MKNTMAVIFSLFLLFSLSCTTTKQEVSKTEEPAKTAEEAAAPAVVNFDLSGDWEFIEDIKAPNCGGDKINTYAVEITQEGDSVTVENIDAGYEWTAKIVGNTIPVAKSQSGKVTIYSYKLTVSADANTLTGKVPWDWDNGTCDGYTNATYKRK